MMPNKDQVNGAKAATGLFLASVMDGSVTDLTDRRYGMESIDAMRGTMSPEEFNGFLKGNAFKYLTRAGAKDALEQDLHKVCWYAMFLYLANGGTVEALGKTYEYMKERFAK